MITNFAKILAPILKTLPSNDYPVLSTQLFFMVWVEWTLNSGVSSFRELFYKLNLQQYSVNRTTFSKACKHRSTSFLYQIIKKLKQYVSRQIPSSDKRLFPIDGTLVTLTSKLFWEEGYHQVKLILGANTETGEIGDFVIDFHRHHEQYFKNDIVKMGLENSLFIMDRGFASYELMEKLSEQNIDFVVRLKSNFTLTYDNNNQCYYRGFRVIIVKDENGIEYRLGTNLSCQTYMNNDIANIYRRRWYIELLWRFMKGYLKLDKIRCKSVQGATMQILMVIIVYLLLLLTQIPIICGTKLLDKLRCIQVELQQEVNSIHWMEGYMTHG